MRHEHATPSVSAHTTVPACPVPYLPSPAQAVRDNSYSGADSVLKRYPTCDVTNRMLMDVGVIVHIMFECLDHQYIFMHIYMVR